MTKEIKPYAFIDRQGNRVTREQCVAQLSTKKYAPAQQSGKAYGFFQCDASKKEVESLLPQIRTDAQTPSELELSLVNGMDNVRDDKQLRALAQRANQEDGINYMFQARCPGKTNAQVANEVKDILEQTYQSQLYKKGDKFKGAIVYQEKGEYVFRN